MALVVLGVKYGPVAGQLLDIVVDRAPQLSASAPAIGRALNQLLSLPIDFHRWAVPVNLVRIRAHLAASRSPRGRRQL